ncbi:MAG: hypothetical protein HS117_10330 [Verrucomicrobiaceae bacterium]|nr:hypothetical protein [Verrucomicrobiaceae bacterium]
MQPDRKLVVAGSTNNGTNDDFAVVRYNEDGSLDLSFGTGGKVISNFGSSENGYALAIQGDSKIVVAGNSSGNDTGIRLARYNPSGNLDTTFGTNGTVITILNTELKDMAVQSDGKLVVVGSGVVAGNKDFAIVRYDENGTLDSQFGTGGIVTTPIGLNHDYGQSVAIQSDGKLVVAGSGIPSVSGQDFALARYLANGSLDPGFGNGGIVTTAISTGDDWAKSVVIQGDGRLVVAGNSATSGLSGDFELVRYNANGSLDNSFGSGGKAIVSLGAVKVSCHSLAMQADDKLIVAGNAGSSTVVVRVNTDGSLDTTFNGTGIQVISNGPANTEGESLVVQEDGKIVVAGTRHNGSNNDVSLLRLLTAPSPPVVTTAGATHYTEFSARLNGNVLPAGEASTAYFEYGLATSYGNVTPAQEIGSSGVIAVQQVVSGLVSGATYHFRLVAANSLGTSYGQDMTFTAVQPQRYEKMVQFSEATGITPLAGLSQGADGYFYGTTSAGGINGQGTVFRLSAGGVLTTLVHFAGSNGSSPRTRMIQASDGNFYGTTYYGGSENRGTVFRMTPAGQLTTLFHFASTNTGVHPHKELVEAGDGNLYGVTQYSSYNSNGQVNFSGGVVYRITKTGQFTVMAGPGSAVQVGGSLSGSSPDTSLIQGMDGALYGCYSGSIFKVTLGGQSSTLSLSSGNGFLGSPSDLLLNDDGYFYGVSGNGGVNSVGGAFNVSSNGAYSIFFNATTTVARNPNTLIKAVDGSFWGTSAGGNNNKGVIFKILQTGEASVVYHFPSTTSGPSKLMQAFDGTFYGTEAGPGTGGNLGSVFRVNADNSVTTVLRFNGANGRYDRASLMQTSDGALYGTGSGGGVQSGNIFTVSPAGTINTLASFDGAALGGDPGAALVKAADGNFYGTAKTGGVNDKGTVFRMTPGGVVTVLVPFDGTNGAFPEAALTLAGDGHLYGTTREGGSSNLGTVFRLTTGGVLTVLQHFTGANGATPLKRMITAADGNLYGTTSAGGAGGSGLVFRLTPASGVMVTVAEFNGANGQSPNELRQQADGSFIGTTRLGGGSNLGTIFHLAGDGTITVLKNFTGADGQWPESALSLAPDGTLWGTTSAGATSDNGTLFKIVAGSIFVPVMDFGSVPDEKPTGPVFFGQDGNLYGTTRNSVFRFLFPGAPIADAGSASSVTTTSAVIDAKVNARGSSTQSTIEYGIDGVSFPLSATAAPLSVSGYTTTRVGAALAGLVSGTRYYYRLRSVSSVGTTVSPVASFATQSLAYAATTPATGLGPTSATLNGIVNAFENSATVTFEYGTDGNTFPFSIAATPGTVTGDADTPVAAAIAGLTKGVTYYFRVRAITTAGTTISGATSFRTLIEPLATTGPALALSTTTARVTGTVQARDADTQVFFEYGSSPTNFPNIIAALPGLVTGDEPTNVAAEVPNLLSGVTYYYRVRASSAGGLTHSSALSFQLQVLSGFTQVFPPAPPLSEGLLIVNLTPVGILSGWRLAGEQQWRASGSAAGGLATGNHTVEFRPVPGWNHPAEDVVTVVSGEVSTFTAHYYHAAATSGTGGLGVVLKPDSLTTGPDRAQWRLLGENDTQWRDSGASVSSLIPGSYLVECKPVAGRETPPNVNIVVVAGNTVSPTITYFVASAATGTAPSVLAYESVTGDTARPYAFVGQLRSNAGAGSGFVVKERVVATAAHVLWNDGTLSAAQGLQWLFQRHRGLHEPQPIEPRGFYLFDSYSGQRAAEATPGFFSPQSQTLDVAALYFTENAGRGGYGGFLASDLTQNEFLLSSANKLLVGYPVDGIAATSQGRMHATSPANVAFTAGFGRTFTTTGLRAIGGNSGGPLCVQFDGGNYYPAAICLGGSGQMVVRAIDSAAVDLFNRAETSGNGGGGVVGGGATLTTIATGGTTGAGILKVNILPVEAAGTAPNWIAAWGLSPDTPSRPSGFERAGLSPGTYIVKFSSVAGFQMPVDQTVVIQANSTSTLTYTYALPMSPQESWRHQHFGSASNSGNAADNHDYDRDGFTNAEEYAAGTNPTQRGDFFRANNPQRGPGTFSVSTAGKAGRAYILERSATMAAGTWSTVDTEGPLAADGPVALTDAASPPGAAFYRIRVTGP